MNWNDLFIYVSETGDLINKVDRNSRSPAGRIAGHKNDQGYLVTRVKGKSYRVHRIIWEMNFGQIPSEYEIDHINRIRDDNRLTNLRIVTSQENNLNLSARKNNSGITGVVWNKKDRKWQAQIGFKGKHIYLGQFNNIEQAINSRKLAEKRLGFRSV